MISAERRADEAAELELARREALSPAMRLQRMLHPWVAFVVMPLFALANAGVAVDVSVASPGRAAVGIILGLVLGKPVGILLACAAAVRLRIAAFPTGIGWRELPVLGLVAGIGFTMALFVAALAFPDAEQLRTAKMGVLVASVIAIVLGLVAGRLLLPREQHAGAADENEAEISDEV